MRNRKRKRGVVEINVKDILDLHAQEEFHELHLYVDSKDESVDLRRQIRDVFQDLCVRDQREKEVNFLKGLIEGNVGYV